MPRRPFAHPARRPRLPFSAALLLLASGSCAPWASIPAPAPVTLAPATQVRVWMRGRGVVLHEVNVSSDSIRGRAVDPLRRGSLVALPRADVDSFQIRPSDSANWFGAGVGGGLLVGVVGAMALCRSLVGD
jgi:hypothetical protein